jgi:hypothetical protein
LLDGETEKQRKTKVSFSIKLTASAASGRADARNPLSATCNPHPQPSHFISPNLLL